jgi:hypothetical protein
MGIMIGSKYKLVAHPYQPIGTAKGWRSNTSEILIEWDDTTLIPPSDYYPEQMFANGSFELIRDPSTFGMYGYLGDYGHDTECSHEWATYTGITREFDYCKKCDIKR